MKATAHQDVSRELVRRFKSYPAYKDSGVDWLGDAPVHWEVKRLKFVAKSNPSASHVRGVAPDTEVSFVPMEAVGEYGGLDLSTTKLLSDVRAGYTFFSEGDVVVAKITPCFENGKGARAQGLTNGIAFGTTELHVVRASEELDQQFLFYTTLSDAFRRLGEAEMYGAGGQKRVPNSFIENLRHPIPPKGEQRAIAQFLDRETARIDALVAKKERLIELLQEKRTALITRAVTKGLKPNVPMKDSGVEWLGEIPAAWNTVRVKSITADHRQGFYTEQAYVDEGVKLARITDIDDHTNVSFATMPFVQIEDRAERLFQIRDEDFLFARSGTIGRFGIARQSERAVFASYLIRFRFKSVSYRFLRYAFDSEAFQQSLKSSLHGGANQNVHAENIKERWIAVPPTAEQDAISAFLDQHTARLDSLVAHVRAAIYMLNELRSAIISAAVTGKVDVREEAA